MLTTIRTLARLSAPAFLATACAVLPAGSGSGSGGGVPDPAVAERWRLPPVPYPEGNEPTPERVALGEKLFFDPRLSGRGNMSCATCHNPAFGWTDGLPTAVGDAGQVLPRATPTVVNAAYNGIQMWDGREPTLESQALGPMRSEAEMHTDFPSMLAFLRGSEGYRSLFAAAYPDRPLDAQTVAMAIAAFERTVVVRDTPFDRWLAGDADAMTAAQRRGFELFTGEARCNLCHSAPNFTDDGFHNVGLASFGAEDPDPGRFAQRPLALLEGAFKTPSLRNVARTAPYFHDGSAPTLEAVVEHYARGGVVKTNLSPSFLPVDLDAREKADLVEFLHALSAPETPYPLPALPRS